MNNTPLPVYECGQPASLPILAMAMRFLPGEISFFRLFLVMSFVTAKENLLIMLTKEGFPIGII